MAAFVRLSHTAAVPPETRILKARDYLAYENAAEIVATARQRADEMAEASKQAYEAEKARGYADGQAEAKLELAEQIFDTVDQTVEYFSHVEAQVAEIVMAAVRKILGDMDIDDVVVRAARNALAIVRDQHEIRLLVNPDQAAGIKARAGDILRGGEGVGYLEVVADYHLLPGECRIETELGVVDVSIDLQLDALEKALKSRVGR